MSIPQMVFDVEDAYRNTGRKPKKGCWIKKGCYACPLAAYALANDIGVDGKRVTGRSIYKWLEDRLGMSYVNGYIEGFDLRMTESFKTTLYEKSKVCGSFSNYYRGFRAGLLSQVRLIKRKKRS